MKLSAGILLYRKRLGFLEFFLVHPGGPFFAKKDKGWWTIPKGEVMAAESAYEAALREFEEETGHRPIGEMLELAPITQKGGKEVRCWAVQGDLNIDTFVSNTFKLEWPPRSGIIKSFPEVDKAGWFDYLEAKQLINDRQAAFLEEVLEKVF
ncbi:Predicted NTP pyrophosphohydrolase, NUDIX family [bacterium A37T11]|nr:Predicted NTP pyrophosphohydrolase, NUDIX family [bacterium A37T11]